MKLMIHLLNHPVSNGFYPVIGIHMCDDEDRMLESYVLEESMGMEMPIRICELFGEEDFLREVLGEMIWDGSYVKVDSYRIHTFRPGGLIDE